jgi:hypothetical protein
MDKWNGILTITEIQHWNSKGELLWEDRNIKNLLHQDGEHFLLGAAFTGGQNSTIIPAYYYLGLDNRQSIAVSDTMDSLIGEPSSGGYSRQAVSSSGDFVLNIHNGHYVANSPIVAFRSTVTGWGPVSNLFLTTAADNSGYLISTAVLGTPVSLAAGDNVTMRIGMRLAGC